MAELIQPALEALGIPMWDLPWLMIIGVYGACVGSFLNVVIYRLPNGQSLLRPASSCPQCGHKLAVYDNVPILGWLWLLGRCRTCKARISIQYPLIEAACAVLFAGLYWVDYFSGWWPSFQQFGLSGTWPVLMVHLVLIAGLVAATAIDARHFIIPLLIPYVIILVALAALPVSSVWLPAIGRIAPTVKADGLAAVTGGAVGLAVALALLCVRILPRSFDNMEEELDESVTMEEIIEHPHVRREVLKELLFLAWPIIGIIAGCWLGPDRIFQHAPSALQPDQLPIQVTGGVVWGYLVGAGCIWITRILGTLAFHKEAMGLGDVHLLGAIGAVLGWRDTVAVFFIAPFLGLVGALVLVGWQQIRRGQTRVIPYGPYLAAAALVLMIRHEQIASFFDIFLKWPPGG